MVKKRLGLRKAFLNLIDKSPFICKLLLFLVSHLLLGVVKVGKYLQLDFDGSLMFCQHIRDTREKKRNLRTIYVNNQRPKDYTGQDEPFTYTSNSIRTSRVSALIFLNSFTCSFGLESLTSYHFAVPVVELCAQELVSSIQTSRQLLFPHQCHRYGKINETANRLTC